VTSALLSARSKLTLATEPFRRSRGNPDDTASTFFERRFGQEAARVLAGAFISGVYAGDPEQLSAAAAFPLFWRFEQETGSMIRGALRHRRQRRRELARRGEAPRRGIFSLVNGLGQLTAALADALGDRCHLGAEVRSLKASTGGFEVTTDHSLVRARYVVIATQPQAAARVVATVDTDLAGLLDGVPMSPVAVVHLGYEHHLAAVPNGFGFLAPRDEGVRTLGVLFPSRLFEGRAPGRGDLLTGFVGGAIDPGALELDDDELVGTVRGDLEALTGLDASPCFKRVRRYPRAIPQLVVGHLERLSTISTLLERHEGLFLAGNYLRGVGMKDAAASGLDAAASVLNHWS
jgi:oxygen-dependent protoporphyrinogen oxidase